MKIAIASYGQETSSFSPALTTLETFRQYGLYEGQDILTHCRGIASVGGFLQAIDDGEPGKCKTLATGFVKSVKEHFANEERLLVKAGYPNVKKRVGESGEDLWGHRRREG